MVSQNDHHISEQCLSVLVFKKKVQQSELFSITGKWLTNGDDGVLFKLCA